MKNNYICLINFFIFFSLSIFMFNLGIFCLLKEMNYFFEIELFSINSCMIEMTIFIDWMSCLFMFCVMLISSMVIFYSNDYMKTDIFMNRFIMLIIMFILSMILLIISPNLISILLGWDGLGLVSYCLVIYYQNIKSYNAGMLTVLSNRIGDVMILISIVWMMNFGSWNFIFYLDLMNTNNDFILINFLLMIAAMTKSAQIPFSAWLPAAMAAPTPVSALVHSSTLVTAGIYLMIRFNNLMYTLDIKKLLLMLSSLTMFMAGLGANFEFDLKKIIALSTLSQLGLMMSILSMGYTNLTFFHLFTHALFKALLFMCAGVIIHNMKNFQDIRFMGSLINQMPFTMMNFNIANLSLCGFFFLAGFYSKDLILETISFNFTNFISYFLFYFSTGLTMCYSIRLMYYTFYSNFNSWTYHPLNDFSKKMNFSMFMLLMMTIFSGSMISWLIFPYPNFILLPNFMKLMVILVCSCGGMMGYFISMEKLFMKSKIFNINIFLLLFLSNMWYLPLISSFNINYYPLYLGNLSIKVKEFGWSENLGSMNLNSNLNKLSIFFQFFHLNLKMFLMMIITWLFVIVIFYL